jgi:uncharacterized protein with beta-barrel porin domain
MILLTTHGFDPTGVRTYPAKLAGAMAVLGLVVGQTSPGHAQAPNMGTAADFAVLAGSTVTNTGPSVLTGNLGVSPGSAITGFPPGIVTPPGATHAANAVAVQAQVDLTTAFNALAGRPTTSNLTGQNLGGLTLTPGVYNFDSSAQLTGSLTLNAQGNPNAVFIFNIGSTLTTASSSTVTVIGGGQGTNVFWRVGSSATLGTTTSFVGDILALTSITLTTGANIACGAALARNGAVTLDTNNIAIGNLAPCTTPLLPVPPVVVPPGLIPVVVPPGIVVPPGVPAVVVPPGIVPPGAVVILVPPDAIPPGAVPLGVIPVTVTPNITPVVAAIDAAFVKAGGAIPPAFLDLSTRTPAELVNTVLPQLSGEAGTGVAQAGIQAMNSFLSLVLNPFAGNPVADTAGGPGVGGSRMIVKALGFAPESPQSPARSAFASLDNAPVGAPDPRRWGIWAAAYGGQNNTTGDPLAGTHDRSARTFGFATGLDHRVTPYTVVGFALAGGGTNYGLSDGLGGGRSDMFQSAVYSLTRVNAAYVSAALAYAWHRVSTDRTLTVAGTDHLTADFSANNVGGRIEGGYRFAIPGVVGWSGFGFTPYAAVQVQAFRTPSFSEHAVSGSSVFALAYDARTTTTTRTELGAWFDRAIALDNGAVLTLHTRAAWAHDHSSDPTASVAFQSLPGSAFTVNGAVPATDSALLSAGAWLRLASGVSVGAKFDGEFATHSQTYAGTGVLRYTW